VAGNDGRPPPAGRTGPDLGCRRSRGSRGRLGRADRVGAHAAATEDLLTVIKAELGEDPPVRVPVAACWPRSGLDQDL